MRGKMPARGGLHPGSIPIVFTIVTYWTLMLIVGCGIHVTGGPFIRQVANDFNGDGIGDTLVGANLEDSGGGNAGAAYVFYGSTSMASSIDASVANVKLIGEAANDQLGLSVASGDVNGDGFYDAIVGAPYEDSGGDSAGAVYVFYGSATMASSIGASLANVKLIGEAADDYFGVFVSSGDVNNDGFDDVIVGAHGEDSGGAGAGATYIFYGSASMASSIDASNANVKLIGEAGGDSFGYSVSSGDINNDGFDDVIVGAPFEDAGGFNAGAAYVFYGSTSLAASIDASLANVKLIGEAANDEFGNSVSSGDANNDGFDDVIVGADAEDSGGSAAGAAYVFYGSASMPPSIDASAANVKLIGEAAGDWLGYSVASGDVNNDGFFDVIVGAQREDSGGDSAGAVYVFYGSATMASSIDASAANVKLIGEAADDDLGYSVASGDVNNDGFDDVKVGAIGEDSGGSAAGAAYVLYGSTSLAASVDASAANVKLIGETGGDSFGRSVD